MQHPIRVHRRLAPCLLAAWLVVAGALAAGATDGAGRPIAVVALLLAALAGLLRPDRREALAVALAAAAWAAWGVSGESDALLPLLAAVGVVATGLLAGWARPPLVLEDAVAADRPAPADGAGVRLAPGIAEATLLERLAVHEMTRARRYERPLTLMLIGVDGWSALLAQHGQRSACDLLAKLATRVRRLLRDVDTVGLHGEGQLAVLLPETPLDGALVVASRVEQTALEELGLKVRIGAAVFPDDAGTVEALMREAEAGLDLARAEGVAVVTRVALV